MTRSLLLAAALAAVAACDRPAPPPAPEHARTADVLLDRLPADTEMVVAASLRDLAGSPAWRRAVGVVAADAPDVAATVGARCGFDPWTGVDAAALVLTAGEVDDLLAARIGAGRDRVHACLAELTASGAIDVRIDTTGPLTAYVQPDGVEVAAWVDPYTIVIAPERIDDAAALDAALGAPARGPAPIAELLRRVDRGATAWAVGVPGIEDLIAEMLGAMPLDRPPWGVHASLRRDRGLRLVVGVVFAAPEHAAAGAALFQRLLDDPPPWLAPWRDALTVEARGDEARAVLALDADRAAALEAQIIDALPPPPDAPPPPDQRLAPTPTSP